MTLTEELAELDTWASAQAIKLATDVGFPASHARRMWIAGTAHRLVMRVRRDGESRMEALAEVRAGLGI